MRLELKHRGLKKPKTYIWVEFSKCGPSLNDEEFYKIDNGVIIGFVEFKTGGKEFNI